MSALRVCGGRVIDPASGLEGERDVLLDNGRIVGVVARTEAVSEGTDVFDATGCIVAPGFIDLHTHLRFPGFPEKETMGSGTAAAAAGGFTTVCAMANTNPVVDSPDVLRQVLDEAARSAHVRVHQLGAVSHGLRGEHITDLRALAESGAVAFSDDGKPIWQGSIMREALRIAGELHKAVSVHEEDPEIVRGGVANSGEFATRLGLTPWPCEGEASLVARDLALLAETGGHLHIAHVSCADTVVLLRRARELGLRVTAEVTPHHLRLSDRLLDGDATLSLSAAHSCTKVNPPLRSEEDVAVMVEALAEGVIDAVATDHAPHTSADKGVPFATAAFGFTAIETALPLVLDLVRAGQLSMSAAIARLTCGPAGVFGVPGGTLRPGAPADLCIFDPDARWRVTPASLHSRGKNTPLLGAELCGRVVATLVQGRFVFRAGAVHYD